MGCGTLKYLGMSEKYRYVAIYTDCKGKIFYQGRIRRVGKLVTDERVAAINVDKQLIAKGKEPINILKRITPKQK